MSGNNRARYRSSLRVRDVRAALGMTQRDFAFYLRVAVGTVSDWERGKNYPSGLADRAIRDLAAQHGLDLHTMRAFALGRRDD